MQVGVGGELSHRGLMVVVMHRLEEQLSADLTGLAMRQAVVGLIGGERNVRSAHELSSRSKYSSSAWAITSSTERPS